jgi:hypothetical protein
MYFLVKDANLFRTMFFMAHGQQAETWLQAGMYQGGGEVVHRGTVVLMLYGVSEHNKGTWYVQAGFAGLPGVTIVNRDGEPIDSWGSLRKELHG